MSDRPRETGGGVQSAGGIFALTGREVGHFCEESYEWSESVFKEVRTTAEKILQEVRPTIDSLFKNFTEALSQASAPPQLSAAAQSDPKKRGR